MRRLWQRHGLPQVPFPTVRIVYTQADEPGWFPITHMVELLARLSDAELVRVPFAHRHTALERLAASIPLRRRGNEDLLVVCPQPGHLQALTHAPQWWSGYRSVTGWVVDSWWSEWIPRLARRRGRFDLLWISEQENREAWQRSTGTQILHLPMGSDVLGNMASTTAPRPIDLLRVGRMPPAWDDDKRTAEACRGAGLVFRGRPPMASSTSEGMRALWSQEAQTKFVLAFSNLASPARYTHPSLEYFTPRWADAIACGASTVGRLPRTSSTADLPETCWADVSANDMDRGIQAIADLAQRWTPRAAARNRQHALTALDWRHRFKKIANQLELTWPRLDEELSSIEAERSRLVGFS